MKTYEFILILPEMDNEIAEAIYEVCNDSSLGKTNGATYVAFDRLAESLESAIDSAIADLKSVNVQPLRIEMEIPATIS